FGILAEALTMRAVQPWLAQRFDEAVLAAVEAVRFASELGAANVAARPLSVLAFVAAIHGDDDEARRLARRVLEVAAPPGPPAAAASAVYGLARLDLGRGRWIEALERVEILDDTRADVGDRHVAKLALPERIEAAVRADRPTEAGEALSA